MAWLTWALTQASSALVPLTWDRVRRSAALRKGLRSGFFCSRRWTGSQRPLPVSWSGEEQLPEDNPSAPPVLPALDHALGCSRVLGNVLDFPVVAVPAVSAAPVG